MHMYLREKKDKERKKYRKLNYPYLHSSGVLLSRAAVA